MPHPLLANADNTTPWWMAPQMAPLYGFVAVVLTAVIAAVNARWIHLRTASDGRRQKKEAGEASVEVEHIQGLHRALERLEAENKALREDAEKAERRHDETRTMLEWKFTRLSTAYYELHRICTAAAPSLALGPLEPFTLMTTLSQPTSISIFTPPQETKKITAVLKTLELPPPKP